jgi:enoyl reductase-like protein
MGSSRADSIETVVDEPVGLFGMAANALTNGYNYMVGGPPVPAMSIATTRPKRKADKYTEGFFKNMAGGDHVTDNVSSDSTDNVSSNIVSSNTVTDSVTANVITGGKRRR